MPKIIDFTSSVIFGDNETWKGTTGPPHYLAPEVFQGKGYNKKADIWSFGITIVYMIEKNSTHLNRRLRPFTRLPTFHLGLDEIRAWDMLSTTFKHFLRICLKLDPKERGSAKDLLKHPFILRTRIHEIYHQEL
jgi:serine/threonine protein kinase